MLPYVTLCFTMSCQIPLVTVTCPFHWFPGLQGVHANGRRQPDFSDRSASPSCGVPGLGSDRTQMGHSLNRKNEMDKCMGCNGI